MKAFKKLSAGTQTLAKHISKGYSESPAGLSISHKPLTINVQKNNTKEQLLVFAVF